MMYTMYYQVPFLFCLASVIWGRDRRAACALGRSTRQDASQTGQVGNQNGARTEVSMESSTLDPLISNTSSVSLRVLAKWVGADQGRFLVVFNQDCCGRNVFVLPFLYESYYTWRYETNLIHRKKKKRSGKSSLAVRTSDMRTWGQIDRINVWNMKKDKIFL